MKTEIQEFMAATEIQRAARPRSSSPAAAWNVLGRGFQEAVILAGCALFLALAVFSHARLTAVPPVITEVADVAPIPEGVFWIDARSEADFSAEHIPGAVCLNEKNWEAALPRFFETWQPPTQIVVYCDAGCPASVKIAARLEELGIEPVKIMEGGFEAWKRSNK